MTAPITTIQLIGCDGSTWDLLDGTSPVTLNAGLGGLHLPSVRHQFSDSVGKPGQRWRGSEIGSKSFTMNILVGDRIPPFRTGLDWVVLDGTFWEAMSTDALSSLIVNGERRLDFRLDENNEYDFGKDPSILGKAVYPIACIAESPLWQGEPVTDLFSWQGTDNTDYYGGPGGGGFGPPFYIAGAPLYRMAMIDNPGDYPAWPVWTITGPVPSAAVGVGDSLIILPFVLNSGDMVIIDTENETITDSEGNNLWPRMGYTPVDMAPIPANGKSSITVGLENGDLGASVGISLVPQYRRAWGKNTGGGIIQPPSSDGGLGHEGLGTGPLGH